MAATDKPYRSPHTLNIVFAVSNLLMLVSVVWMFWEDHYREWKPEQRGFRDVEAAMAQRVALELIPGQEEFDKVEGDVKKAREESGNYENELLKMKGALEKKLAKTDGASKSTLQEEAASLQKRIDDQRQIQARKQKLLSDIAAVLPKKESSETAFQLVKANLESKTSLYNIAVDDHGLSSAKARELLKELEDLTKELVGVQAARDQNLADLQKYQRDLDAIDGPLTRALGLLKKTNDRFDTQIKLAMKKTWGWGDWFRALPVIDGFASPLRIHQFTIDNIPIDYNFKYVTRFDRCMTCHQGIDRPNYTRENLRDLTRVTDAQAKKLLDAWALLNKRQKSVKGLEDVGTLPTKNDLEVTTVSSAFLTEARVSEFCVHPRLDLFVGSNSKHPTEKFGCTSCHAGQGSGTGFLLSSHTPNDSKTKDRWIKDYRWNYAAHEGTALWDFPMLPSRFIESSCLKCHHQVTDLYGPDNRNEAPKLLRGFNLIKENGCFGCHEIAGRKGGKAIGPDLRLEPYPPLEDLTPEERAKLESDPDNPPGGLRKVGPSLFRLAEKTNHEWTAKWLALPRAFRPDTKMPHFYNTSNNNKEALAGTDQIDFPDAEMQSVAYYLFAESNKYLDRAAALARADGEGLAKGIDFAQRDRARAEALNLQGKLSADQAKELLEINERIKLRQVKPLVDLSPNYPGDPAKGRVLFAERGCLSCHSHQGTNTSQGQPLVKDKDKEIANPLFSPKIVSEANFGPNLSQLSAKLGKKAGDKASARVWLMQWVSDPQFHSPRSRMPVTHLSGSEAADLAAWLLSQPARDHGPEWADLNVPEPTKETLQKLANVYLVRLLSKSDVENFAQGKEVVAINDLPNAEKALFGKFQDVSGLKHYLGRKALGRLGCYACHDIPGFENAKPIGVALNDWGKKDPDRLAFEDIKHYFDRHFFEVQSLVDKDGKPHGVKNGKEPYEKFYGDLLLGHRREGYLHQKIRDPRSFDYNRLRTWDDRSRMPQFRFARDKKGKDESDADFEARGMKAEAEAREAVMTFILGLTAEQVPSQSINQPTGDRLAEVKGRQILDKFNCGGCHLIRPGVYEFKTSPEMADLLAKRYDIGAGARKSEHFFADHAYWVGRNPTADKLTAFGVFPTMIDDDDVKYFQTTLTYALRFEAKDRSMKDLGASNKLWVLPDNMIYPSPAIVKDPEKLKEFLRTRGPFGGTYGELLIKYLREKDPTAYKDDSAAAVAVPPSIVGQGERTQGDWLYRFLLDPQPIRKMTVLRMPKFNMSKEEARTLVQYFTAVERTMNPGVGLTAPFEQIPQQGDLNNPFWTKANQDYVSRLKSTYPTTKGKDGKEEKSGDKSWYNKRMEELTPIWLQIQRENQDLLKAAQGQLKVAKEQAEKGEELAKSEKDPIKKKVLEDQAANLGNIRTAWETEVKSLEVRTAQSAPDQQQELFGAKEAYITDAFRMLNNKQLCGQCHAIRPGMVVANQVQGPALYNVHERLRPGWLERWIAVPSHMVPHASLMPINFPADENNQYQNLLAGNSLDRIRGARDVLMNYPRAISLPAARYLVVPLPVDKSGDKK